MALQAHSMTMSAFDNDAARWAAVQRRDREADGRFVFAVRSTGIYCRPSCPARRPKRENVTFHATRDTAERAGFRPCKRCRPDAAALDARHADAIARACRLIDAADEMPTLDVLAKAAGMSRFHFHRQFKAFTGVTPRAYAAAHRAERMRDQLTRSATVTEAVYESGFNSSGRFYAAAPAALGMAPARFRAGGAGEEIRYAISRCSLGLALIAATGKGVCAVSFGDSRDVLVDELKARFPQARLARGDEPFSRLVAQVLAAVETRGSASGLPLDIRGTAFQRRVWQALQRVPPGATVSYAELAARIGAPASIRAVASACASNTLAVVVPCHRVVRSDGGVSGYRWGVKRKQALLAREQSLRS